MPKLFDRVKVNIPTTGTGTVTFGPASSPAFLTPSEAGAVDGNTVRYVFVDGTDFEEGVGTILASVAQMSRDTVTRSKIGGSLGSAKINLSGTAVLVFTASAVDILNPANNLNDVASAAAARGNLGISATNTPFTAAGTIAATNTQAAVQELDTENQSAHGAMNSAISDLQGSRLRYDIYTALTAAQRANARASIGVPLKNYIINGAMMVSQENGSSAGSTTGFYPVDQFVVFHSTDGAFQTAQVAAATSAGSPNRIGVIVTTADTSIGSTQLLAITQNIEGFRIADLGFGAGGTKTFTLKFGVKAPAGTYAIGFRNGGSTRSYVAEFVISAPEANTDVYRTVTVPGDVSGIWAKDTGPGLSVSWLLACGASYQTTPNSWQSGNYFSTSNQFNLMGTLSNTFQLFDVGIYEGSTAPDFVVPDFADELDSCQRYFWTISAAAATNHDIGSGIVYSANIVFVSVDHPTIMCKNPTITYSALGHFLILSAGGNYAPSALTVNSTAVAKSMLQLTPATNLTAGQGCIFECNSTSARLHFNARL